jgi:hypothetical protein
MLYVGACVTLLLVAGCVACAQRLVLFPRRVLDGSSPVAGIDVIETLSLGPGGGVEAWYLPPPDTGARAPAIVFTHGNAELIDDWLPVFADVPKTLGVGVLLVEYPGYGRSAGAPSQASIAAVMREAFDAIAARPEIDAAKIVAYGRSLGGGAACGLAAERPVAALILESTFTSVRPLARRFGLIGPLLRDPFDSLPVVARFSGPVLIVHGAFDAVIPVSHAVLLAAAARSGELHRVPCGHNDCPRPWRVIEAFLARAGLLPGPADRATQPAS